MVVGAFAIAAGLAGLFGARSLGVALAFGQIAFAIAVSWVLLRTDA